MQKGIAFSWIKIAFIITIAFLSVVKVCAVGVDVEADSSVHEKLEGERELTHAERLLFESSEAGDVLGIKKALRLGVDISKS